MVFTFEKSNKQIIRHWLVWTDLYTLYSYFSFAIVFYSIFNSRILCVMNSCRKRVNMSFQVKTEFQPLIVSAISISESEQHLFHLTRHNCNRKLHRHTANNLKYSFWLLACLLLSRRQYFSICKRIINNSVFAKQWTTLSKHIFSEISCSFWYTHERTHFKPVTKTITSTATKHIYGIQIMRKINIVEIKYKMKTCLPFSIQCASVSYEHVEIDR